VTNVFFVVSPFRASAASYGTPRGEAAKKLGQAPWTSRFPRLFPHVGREPIPFFHSPGANNDSGTVIEHALACFFACLTIVACPLGTAAEQNSGVSHFVRVSPRDSRYFELTDGRPYIPVGFNLVGPPPAEDLERVVNEMADHGVNYCRIWLDHPRLRIYALRGKATLLAWCRDRENDWRNEFERSIPPGRLSGLQLDLASRGLDPAAQDLIADVYDPWQDTWAGAALSGTTVTLPDFQRSLVVRVFRPKWRRPTKTQHH
jgi:hypothetical protein